MRIRHAANGMLAITTLVLSGCVTVTHKVEPIDITLHIMVDEKLDSFFDYQDKPAATPPPKPADVPGAAS